MHIKTVKHNLRNFYLHVRHNLVESPKEEFLKTSEKYFLKFTKPNQKRVEITEAQVEGMMKEACVAFCRYVHTAGLLQSPCAIIFWMVLYCCQTLK